jgi:hypothetical protein
MTVYIPFSTSFHRFILSLVHLDPYSSDAVRANRKGSFCPRCLGNESVFAVARNEDSFSTVKLEAREAFKLMKSFGLCVQAVCDCDLRHHSLVWLYLRDWDRHTALVLPESSRGWLEIAGDWLLESLPEIALYVLRPKGYPYSIADLMNGLVGKHPDVLQDLGFEVVRSATLDAMTRLGLLMNPSISLEGLPLSDWFQSTFGIPHYQDRYILVRIGDRSSLLQPLRTGSWRHIQKKILKTELLVADHLAVLSTLLGYTELSVTDIAVLMSTLWARACVLAPKISSRIIGSTSSLLLTYLLHVEDLGALVPVLNRIGGNIEIGDVCRFRSWSIDQGRFIRTLNLLRSQLGTELFPQFLTKEAVHGEQDEVRHH